MEAALVQYGLAGVGLLAMGRTVVMLYNRLEKLQDARLADRDSRITDHKEHSKQMTEVVSTLDRAVAALKVTPHA
jgi:hypothetical protein